MAQGVVARVGLSAQTLVLPTIGRHSATTAEIRIRFRRRSTMGLEPVGAEAKRTLGRGLHRAIGAPSAGVADTEEGESNRWMPH